MCVEKLFFLHLFDNWFFLAIEIDRSSRKGLSFGWFFSKAIFPLFLRLLESMFLDSNRIYIRINQKNTCKDNMLFASVIESFFL